MGTKSSKLRKKLSAHGDLESDDVTRKTMADTMVNAPLLTTLTENQRNQMESKLERRTFKPGQNIIKQGDQPDGFYIIEYGEAEVLVKKAGDATEAKGHAVATLSVGDYFGERALIAAQPRVATVVAIGKVDCFYLSKENFKQVLGQSPEIKEHFPKRDAVCAEATNTLVNLTHKPRFSELKKSGKQKRAIDAALKANSLFSQYDEDQIIRIGDAMYLQSIKKGEAPVKQGEYGDHVYVVEEGEFQITASNSEGKVRVITSIQKGNVFGELALMYNIRRNATVTAIEDSKVWVLDRFTFRRIILNTSAEKLKEYKDFLKKVPLLKTLSRVEREKVAEALDELTYKSGETIVSEGEIGYGPGDYFGELAIKDETAKSRRQATVKALAGCVLLKLSSAAVNLLLGPVEEFIKKGIKKYSSSSATVHKDGDEGALHNAVKFEDLQVIGRLGNGAFGLVRLVEDKKNPGKTFALKAVSKLKVVRSKQEAHLVNEKRILSRVHHPFCTRLYATYQDDRSVFFLIEPCLGGELFTILRSNTSFSESTSKFYAATVVEIFCYLQHRNIIYRDLKPENLLLDSRGYLKMTDFGFAKSKTYTLCGTPDYLAPEIVVGKGHGKAVDWWTLGVLIYEMVAGYPPFYASKPMRTYQKIIHAKVKCPVHFSLEVVSIIKKLLNRKPSARLGVTHGGPEVVKKQAWFKGFKWDKLMACQLKPPIIPKVKSTTDIGNFRKARKKDPEPPEYHGDNTWCKEF
eukprot:jgi/Bigna1/132776/aug1.19_g7484